MSSDRFPTLYAFSCYPPWTWLACLQVHYWFTMPAPLVLGFNSESIPFPLVDRVHLRRFTSAWIMSSSPAGLSFNLCSFFTGWFCFLPASACLSVYCQHGHWLTSYLLVVLVRVFILTSMVHILEQTISYSSPPPLRGGLSPEALGCWLEHLVVEPSASAWLLIDLFWGFTCYSSGFHWTCLTQLTSLLPMGWARLDYFFLAGDRVSSHSLCGLFACIGFMHS